MSTVLLLGAGFSRAISQRSPLTDELGDLVTRALPDHARPGHRFVGGYFEAWLSRLAEPQPDLSQADNVANQATYLRIVEAIHEVLLNREQEILNSVPPAWLETLIAVAHADRLTMCTFNYDLLVEHSISRWPPTDWSTGNRASWRGATENIPGNPPGHAFWGETHVDTFRLLKLHGSINQYWVPGDRNGATIARWNFEGGWGQPVEVDRARLRQMLPGRSAFLVPPAAAKSAMYDNPITSQIWRDTRAALVAAREVALVGYSMPQTDLVTSGMLAETLGRRDVGVTVVNPEPAPIVDRLEAIGIGPSKTIDGHDAVERFVDDLVRRRALELTEQLTRRPLEPDVPLLVGWDLERTSIVTTVERDQASPIVRLRINNPEPAHTACRRREPDETRPAEGADVTRLLRHDDVLVATTPSGQDRLIVDRGSRATNTGWRSSWTVLSPAGGVR